MDRKVIGASLLVAGCSIGAGMLGVPVITGPCGFLPAIACFLFAWLFMLFTGLILVDLVLEARKNSKTDIHLITLASKSFGRSGVLLVWALFSFLFYCVMTAYMLGGGGLIVDGAHVFGITLSHSFSFLIVAGIGAIVVLYGARFLDRLNQWLMLGLVVTYCILILAAASHIDLSHLGRSSWAYAPYCLPVMIISFGYHNLVPSLVTYLDYDRRAIRKAIICGSLVPLTIYFFWEVAILGVIPFTTSEAWVESVQSGDMVTQVLARTSGMPWVVRASEAFALFALATSFLPVAWSFVDFLRDAAKEVGCSDYKGTKVTLGLILAVFVPPLVISSTNPHLFLSALSAAGGYFAVTLFGILPALIAFKLKIRSRVAMIGVIAFALLVMGIEFSRSFG